MKRFIGNVCLGIILCGLIGLIGILIWGFVHLWLSGAWYVPAAFMILGVSILGYIVCEE